MSDLDMDLPITADQLAHEVGVDPALFDREFPDVYLTLLRFGKLIPDWQELAPALNLTQQEINDVRTDLSLSTALMRITKVLKKWKSRNGVRAKYRRLVEAYLELDKRDVAEKICRAVNEVEKDKPSPAPVGAPPAPPQYMVLQSLHCGMEEQVGGVDVPDNVSSGSIRPNKMWVGYQDKPLRVHFLNPDRLKNENWTFDGKVLTTSVILAWATYWNSHADFYPKIDITEASIMEAEIRVWFNPPNVTSNWSKVGADASKVAKGKPTMVLNLNVNGMTDKNKRSMVLHEFGHALGLDHEHQRSDFWDVLDKKDAQGKLKFTIPTTDMNRAVREHFKEAPVVGENSLRSVYDPMSIMHYWFDVEWLLPKYHDLRKVQGNPDLTTIERRVLIGVHTRHYLNGQLVENPSKLDFQVLNQAYGLKAEDKSTQCNEIQPLSTAEHKVEQSTQSSEL